MTQSWQLHKYLYHYGSLLKHFVNFRTADERVKYMYEEIKLLLMTLPGLCGVPRFSNI